MIFRLPRVLEVELPEGQDWTFSNIDGEDVILVNEALDEDARRNAVNAAYASLRKGMPAWVPLPLVAAGSWLGKKARTPFGSAVTASVLTAAAVYMVTTLHDPPRPIAGPPVVVTLQPTVEPTATSTPVSSARATHRPVRSHPPATRAAAHHNRSSAPTRPVRSPISSQRRSTPRPSPTSAPPSAAVAPTTQAPAPEATLEPPAAGMTPPEPESATSSVEADVEELTTSDGPTSLDGATGCGGIHVGASVDPGLDLDLCLLG